MRNRNANKQFDEQIEALTNKISQQDQRYAQLLSRLDLLESRVDNILIRTKSKSRAKVLQQKY